MEIVEIESKRLTNEQFHTNAAMMNIHMQSSMCKQHHQHYGKGSGLDRRSRMAARSKSQPDTPYFNNYNMKSGQRGSHGITLVSHIRQSKDAQTLTRKKSVESLTVKQKPSIKTTPSECEDFRLEVRQNTLMEETCALADLLDIRQGINRLKTQSSRRHQLRASSAPKCQGVQMAHATPSKKVKECSPSVKTFETTDRSSADKQPAVSRRISTRLNIDLEQIIQSHVKKNLSKGNTEIESIFAKGIRKKLAQLENTFRNSTSAFPTPTFRKGLTENNHDSKTKFTGKKQHQGKQNKKFLFD